MKSIEELEEISAALALELGREHVAKEAIVDNESYRLDWDEGHVRFTHGAAHALVRRYSAFEVVLDDADKVVGFVDYDKYAPSPLFDLNREDIVAILANEHLVPRDGVIADVTPIERGDGTGFVSVRVRLPSPREAYDTLLVDIHTKRRAVIAVRPSMEAPRG